MSYLDSGTIHIIPKVFGNASDVATTVTTRLSSKEASPFFITALSSDYANEAKLLAETLKVRTNVRVAGFMSSIVMSAGYMLENIRGVTIISRKIKNLLVW